MINNYYVSVIIPFYKGVDWLEEAINSVYAQTFKEYEIIVVNDGSPEDITLLKKKFSSVKWINQDNQGVSTARNNGIKNAIGEYIAFLDSDDIWHPTKLEVQYNYMKKNDINWSHHSYLSFKENYQKLVNTSIHRGKVYNQTFVSFKVQTSSVMINHQYLKDNNIFFPENLHYGEDMELYRELAQTNNLGYINSALTYYRLRGTNAGVRAKVQIQDKAQTYQKYKYYIKDNFGISFYISYYVTNLLSSIIDFLEKISLKEVLIEKISKFFYIIPYTLMRLERNKFKNTELIVGDGKLYVE